jgi:hypothetical protein
MRFLSSESIPILLAGNIKLKENLNFISPTLPFMNEINGKVVIEAVRKIY